MVKIFGMYYVSALTEHESERHDIELIVFRASPKISTSLWLATEKLPTDLDLGITDYDLQHILDPDELCGKMKNDVIFTRRARIHIPMYTCVQCICERCT